MVDPEWLNEIRRKNRAKFGMDGLGESTAQSLVDALNRSRDARNLKLKPPPPPPGSAESIMQALPPMNLPGPGQVPNVVWLGLGVAAAAMLAIATFSVFGGD